MQCTGRPTRWVAAILGAAVCGLLASCTSASAAPPPSASSDLVAPTESDRAWARTGFSEDQRPAVEPVRLVSIFERAEAVAACLRGVGYPHVVVVNGEIETGETAEAQQGSLALSTYICEAQYPADPLFDRPLRADQIRALYRYRSTEQRTCLQGLGHAIALPPNEHAFVDGYAEHGGWNPMNNVPVFAFAAAQTSCPPLPAEFDAP